MTMVANTWVSFDQSALDEFEVSLKRVSLIKLTFFIGF
jgi:hypothetical protein